MTMPDGRIKIYSMQQTIHSHCPVAAALIVAVFLLCGVVCPRNVAAQTVGELLFEKHCAGCHPDRKKLIIAGPLRDSLRKPPPRMPAFDEDTLTDDEARAIGEYIRPGSQPSTLERKPSAKAGKSVKEKKSWRKGFGTDDL